MSNINLDTKIRVWVTSDKDRTFSTGSKTLVFNIKKKEFIKLMKFIDSKHSIWTMAIVYSKKGDSTGTELKRYYNFENKRTFPADLSEI